MQFMLPTPAVSLPQRIAYPDKVLLIGSCFTEHMAARLAQHKFPILQNPHGILFNPLSVAHSLNSYLTAHQYTASDLFHSNGTWNSWDHHSRFSHTNKEEALTAINHSQQEATTFIQDAGWVIITLGSAFQYYLKEKARPVANNHRAPGQWFEKKLLPIDTIVATLSNTLQRLFTANPAVNVIFTISPVRHIRDGVVENNQSKARLIDAVHTLRAGFTNTHYFPAYELIIDVLRDYRFYDLDLVHPNYSATGFVWDEFVKGCIAPQALPLMEQLKDITTARAHRTRFPDTEEHRKFMAAYATKTKLLQEQYPYLNLGEELAYFTGEG